MNQIKFNPSTKEFAVSLEVHTQLDADYYVVYCPALELAGQGKSEKEAIDSLIEILTIQLEDGCQKNALDAMFEQFGWTKNKQEYRSSIQIPDAHQMTYQIAV